jgi:hypothetical protein
MNIDQSIDMDNINLDGQMEGKLSSSNSNTSSVNKQASSSNNNINGAANFGFQG